MLDEFPPEIPCPPKITEPAELVGFDSEALPSGSSSPAPRASSPIFAGVSAAKSIRELVSIHDRAVREQKPSSSRIEQVRRAGRPLAAFAGGLGLAIAFGVALERNSQSLPSRLRSDIALPVEQAKPRENAKVAEQAKQPDLDALAGRGIDSTPAQPQPARQRRPTDELARAAATSGRRERVVPRAGIAAAVTSAPPARAVNTALPASPVVAAYRSEVPSVLPTLPPAAVSPAILVEASPPILNDEGAVRSILERYRGAYDRLDAYAAKTVWPSLDEDRLARAFSDLDSQTMVFDACRIDVGSTRGVASCSGRMTYVARVGSRSARTQARTWTFQLQKHDAGWTIDSVRAR